MKHLRPESLDVYAVYVLSWGFEEELETPRTRRFFMGLFESSVTEPELLESIDEHQVLHRLAGSQVLSSNGPVKISMVPRKITEGIVFESAAEACQLLAQGISYEDILDGYALSAHEEPF